MSMKKVLKIVMNVLSWIVLVFALLVTIVVFSSGRNNGVANLLGYIPMTVESNSMYPTFAEGDMIICREIDDVNALQEGDVITFWTIIDGKRVKNTHRIISINQAENSRSFNTRGDNNSLDDDMPAYAGDLIGKWTNVRISGAGKAMNFLRTKTGFFVCILIPMAIFFLFELYKFIIVLIEVKRGDMPEIDEEEIKRRAIEEYLAQQKQAGAPEPPAPAAAEAVQETAPAAAETVQETAPAAAETVQETAPAAAETVQEAAADAAETVQETAPAAAETVQEAAADVQDTTTKTAEDAATV